MRTKILIALLLTLTFITASHAQTLNKAKLDSFFDRLLEKNRAMGSLTIARNGIVLYTRSFGYSQINGAENKPLTAATKYRIASITKTFTAVMTFQLVEEGKLKLTDTLDKFFPQIPNAGRITIAQILNHRSGIPNVAPDGSWGMQSRTKDEVVARIAQGQPEFEPDSRLLYSNTGYVLLGYIIEAVDGKTYQAALTQRITSRIGLNDTYAGAGTTDPGKNESLSYRYNNGWVEAAELHFSVLAGAGAIVSTPSDLARFMQAVFDLKLVSQDSLNQMKTMRDGEGMGLVPFSVAGRTLYGTSGGSSSSGAWLGYLPEEKLAVAYTTNAKLYPVSDIMKGIFDIYWDRPFEIPSFETVELSPEVLDLYVGLYTSPTLPIRMTISRNGTTLYIQPAGQSLAPLEATAENKFNINPAIGVEFDVSKNQMTIKRPVGDIVLTKEK